MSTILDKIGELKLVPVAVIEDADHAVPLAEALMAGGLPCAEVTFRTQAAGDAIRRMAGIQDLLIGAGTVLTVDQVKEAVDAGARFIVSPGFNPRVVEYCKTYHIPVTPGVCTPTEIDMALAYDLTVLKFFPAEALGGVKLLKAISAPYGMVKFIPTGGINAQNVMAYLASPKVHACGGSWMAKKDMISSGRFAEITRLTREAVDIIHSV